MRKHDYKKKKRVVGNRCAMCEYCDVVISMSSAVEKQLSTA